MNEGEDSRSQRTEPGARAREEGTARYPLGSNIAAFFATYPRDRVVGVKVHFERCVLVVVAAPHGPRTDLVAFVISPDGAGYWPCDTWSLHVDVDAEPLDLVEDPLPARRCSVPTAKLHGLHCALQAHGRTTTPRAAPGRVAARSDHEPGR